MWHWSSFLEKKWGVFGHDILFKYWFSVILWFWIGQAIKEQFVLILDRTSKDYLWLKRVRDSEILERHKALGLLDNGGYPFDRVLYRKEPIPPNAQLFPEGMSPRPKGSRNDPKNSGELKGRSSRIQAMAKKVRNSKASNYRVPKAPGP